MAAEPTEQFTGYIGPDPHLRSYRDNYGFTHPLGSPFRVVRLVPVEGSTGTANSFALQNYEQSAATPELTTGRDRLRQLCDLESLGQTGHLFDQLELAERYAGNVRPVADDVRVMTTNDQHVPRTIRNIARRLYSRVYLLTGIVTHDQLDEVGLIPIEDEMEGRTVRWVGVNGHRVAAAGQIHSNKEDGILSLPTFAHLQVDPKKLFAATGVQKVADLKPDEIVEVTGLGVVTITGRGKTRGENNPVHVVYFDMLARSLVDRVRWWTMNAEDRLRDDVAAMAQGNVYDLGDLQSYMGPETRPIILDVHGAVRNVLTSDEPEHMRFAQYLKNALRGADDANIPVDIRQLLREQGVVLRSETRRQRMLGLLRDPHIQKGALVASLVVPSVARDFAARAAGIYDADLFALMIVDGATAAGQAWAMYEGWTARTAARRALGALATGLCFAAPYGFAYLMERQKHPEGPRFPWYTTPVIATYVGLVVAKQILAIRKENKLRHGLLRSDIHGEHTVAEPSQKLNTRLLLASQLQ